MYVCKLKNTCLIEISEGYKRTEKILQNSNLRFDHISLYLLFIHKSLFYPHINHSQMCGSWNPNH